MIVFGLMVADSGIKSAQFGKASQNLRVLRN